MEKRIIKNIFFLCLFFLCSCAVQNGSLTVRSELEKVKKEKTVYYYLTNSSVLNARINRIVRNELEKKGWKIVKDKKNANYIYIAELTSLNNESLRIKSYRDFNSIETEAYEIYHTYPVFFISILDKETHENVYEAFITLTNNMTYFGPNYYTKEDLLNSFDALAKGLFLEKDEYFDIQCEYVPQKDKEAEEKCLLKKDH